MVASEPTSAPAPTVDQPSVDQPSADRSTDRSPADRSRAALDEPVGPRHPAPRTPAAARNRPSGRLRWRRRVAEIEPEPPARALTADGRPLIVVPQTDFVVCSYQGCGALRPLDDATANLACPACGRV